MPTIAITPLGAIPRRGKMFTSPREAAATRSVFAQPSVWCWDFRQWPPRPPQSRRCPARLMARPVSAPAPVPELRRNPGLFRSIIEAAFPAATPVKPAACRSGSGRDGGQPGRVDPVRRPHDPPLAGPFRPEGRPRDGRRSGLHGDARGCGIEPFQRGEGADLDGPGPVSSSSTAPGSRPSISMRRITASPPPRRQSASSMATRSSRTRRIAPGS